MEIAQAVSHKEASPHRFQSSGTATPEEQDGSGHVEALVQALNGRSRRSVRVEKGAIIPSAPVRVDVIVCSETERIGIVCDAADARRISREPAILNELFVERIYTCSALDVILDPEGVVWNVATSEPRLFNGSSRRRRRPPRFAWTAKRSSIPDIDVKIGSAFGTDPELPASASRERAA